MDWKEEMKAGMQMIKSACRKNENCIDCDYCPFFNYCNRIFDEYDIPSEWDLEEKENEK